MKFAFIHAVKANLPIIASVRVLVLLVLVAAPSPSEAANLFVEGGVGFITEGGERASFVGVGALFPATDWFSFGGRLRLHWTPHGDEGSPLFLIATRVRIPVARLRTWAGFAIGDGQWQACLAGDVCGGGGPAADAEIGVDLPIVSALKIAVSADLLMQTGLANVGAAWIPSLSLAVGI